LIDSTIVRLNPAVEGFGNLRRTQNNLPGSMMFCPRSLSGIKKLPVLEFSVLLVIISALPSSAADKVRVAFSAVSPSQGVLWVADLVCLFIQDGRRLRTCY